LQHRHQPLWPVVGHAKNWRFRGYCKRWSGRHPGCCQTQSGATFPDGAVTGAVAVFAHCVVWPSAVDCPIFAWQVLLVFGSERRRLWKLRYLLYEPSLPAVAGNFDLMRRACSRYCSVDLMPAGLPGRFHGCLKPAGYGFRLYRVLPPSSAGHRRWKAGLERNDLPRILGCRQEGFGRR
jgi:hypothetical protein